jgi:hypothetical protein
MTPEDRDLLLALRRQQEELHQNLARLTAQLGALEDRAGQAVTEPSSLLPPLPAEATFLPIPPPAEPRASLHDFPAIPAEPVAPVPPPAPPMSTPRPSFEFQFGRWLMRIGAVFGVVALALVFVWAPVLKILGHAGLLAMSAGASIVVVIIGGRMESKGRASLILGRTITAMALAWLYLTAYASCYYEPLRVFTSPLIAGFLLVIWSLYVLLLAERRKSQFFGAFAIALAYVSTSLNPVDAFTMGADLLLAATAAIFLLRHGWSALATLSVIGTYQAPLRRLVIDENGEFVLDTRSRLHFWASALYLVLAWLIFTIASLLTSAPTFRGGKRRAFISLNNAAVAGLMALAAYIAGYGPAAVGWTLIDTGLVFLITSRFAEIAVIDPVDVMGAYAAQGLALITGGILIVYTGLTRAVLLLIETFLLGVAAAFSGDRILTVSTYVSAFFATVFLIWEMAFNGHHPWLLGFGGALVMLINAWSCRGEVRTSPVVRSTIVGSTSCYCLLALALIYTALSTELSDSALPPALAFAALVLTFSIYYFDIYELPPLAQSLLIAALFLVLFPTETGEELPAHSTGWVAAITLLLITWWSRQRVTRSGSWTMVLTFLYALALAGLAHQAVRPYLEAQGWIVGASLLSLIFLVYGALARVWALAAVGQIFLALALYHFFFPPNRDVFPWSGRVAAVPVAVIYLTARAARGWLRTFTEIPEMWSAPSKKVSSVYQMIALIALIRWVFGIIPEAGQVAAFLFLGTFILSINVRQPSPFGVRCSFVLSSIGMLLYLGNLEAEGRALATAINAFALLLFLMQTGLLRHEGKYLVTPAENWAHIIFSSGTTWIFVSTWAWIRLGPGYLTMSWALDALFLFLFGLLVREPRLRWCGMAVVLAAIVRVLCCDMWSLASGYRVLTFIVLALITLGIGFVILRRSDHRPQQTST